jgi:hypothetical protein
MAQHDQQHGNQHQEFQQTPATKIKHTALLLGRLGLEPCCTREDVEIRWLTLVDEARKQVRANIRESERLCATMMTHLTRILQGVEIDSITAECYQLLQVRTDSALPNLFPWLAFFLFATAKLYFAVHREQCVHHDKPKSVCIVIVL